MVLPSAISHNAAEEKVRSLQSITAVSSKEQGGYILWKEKT